MKWYVLASTITEKRKRHLATHSAMWRLMSLADMLDDRIAKVEATAKGDILNYVKPEALVETLDDTLAGVKAEKDGNPLNEIEHKALVYTKADTLQDVETERVSDTLGDKKAALAAMLAEEILVAALADWPAEMKAKILREQSPMKRPRET